MARCTEALREACCHIQSWGFRRLWSLGYLVFLCSSKIAANSSTSLLANSGKGAVRLKHPVMQKVRWKRKTQGDRGTLPHRNAQSATAQPQAACRWLARKSLREE